MTLIDKTTPSGRISVEYAGGLNRERFVRDYERTHTPCLILPTECQSPLLLREENNAVFELDYDSGATFFSVDGFLERELEQHHRLTWKASSSSRATTTVHDYFLANCHREAIIWTFGDADIWDRLDDESPRFCGPSLGQRTVRLARDGATEPMVADTSACRWVFACQGSLRWQLDGLQFVQRAGELVFVPPGSSGSLTCIEAACMLAGKCAPAKASTATRLFEKHPDLLAVILEWLPTRDIIRVADLSEGLELGCRALPEIFWTDRLLLDFDEATVDIPPLERFSTSRLAHLSFCRSPRKDFRLVDAQRRLSPGRHTYALCAAMCKHCLVCQSAVGTGCPLIPATTRYMSRVDDHGAHTRSALCPNSALCDDDFHDDGCLEGDDLYVDNDRGGVSPLVAKRAVR